MTDTVADASRKAVDAVQRRSAAILGFHTPPDQDALGVGPYALTVRHTPAGYVCELCARDATVLEEFGPRATSDPGMLARLASDALSGQNATARARASRVAPR